MQPETRNINQFITLEQIAHKYHFCNPGHRIAQRSYDEYNATKGEEF